MTNEDRTNRRMRVGRKPKKDRAKFRYTVNLNEEENRRFLLILSKSGMTNVSRFINHALFNKEIKVVKIDKATMDYYIRLTNFYHQFQAIGNNYNQIVKAIYHNFGEKAASVLLAKVVRATAELIVVSKQIIALTKEYEQKWLKKQTKEHL